MIKFFDNYGEYVPGFFKISISKKLHDEIKLEEFTKEEFATLVHEYVHFLQDISTTRGIVNFLFVSKVVQLNFAQAAKCDTVITLPLNIEKAGDSEAYQEQELLSFYGGCDEQIRIHHIDKICREKEEIIYEIANEELYNINVYYDGIDCPYIFGTTCIAESMAYIIEHELFGAEEGMNEFPYNLCELICEKEYHIILQKKSILVALCELSLRHYHSGDMFWRILTEMKDKKLNFNSVSDFENYFLPKTLFLYEDYINGLKGTQECIDFLYPTSFFLFEPVNKCVKDFMKKGYGARTGCGLFIARLFESNYPPAVVVNKWMHYFGMTIICDKELDIYSTNNLSPVLTPLALYNFLLTPIITDVI